MRFRGRIRKSTRDLLIKWHHKGVAALIAHHFVPAMHLRYAVTCLRPMRKKLRDSATDFSIRSVRILDARRQAKQ